ncbi:MAG: glycosyltransferase family 2 protein [Methylocystis silviterrae]|uniref:glycosyltransferase family 2 protein n=1 Tax=Methylocystis silviterrae TaxID=2743612 RepID=UPI003C745637
MPSANEPLVSVITGVYNGERFLTPAIESILEQTLRNFEYIIVDDGSSDATPTIATRYAAKDKRVRALRNEKNLGANGALNRGLRAARAPYVAVLDGDDLAYPERLAEQLNFLEQNPEIGVLGFAVNVIDEDGRVLYCDAPNTNPAHIEWEMLFSCEVTHSAACMRRELLQRVGGYSPNHRYATEYELFSRLLDRTRFANLSSCLGAYRRSQTQMSFTSRSLQHGEVALMQHSVYWRRFGIRVGLEEIDSLYRGVRNAALESEVRVRRAIDLLNRLYHNYLATVRPSAEVEEFVRQDCAYKAFMIAHRNRALDVDLHCEIMNRALDWDPELYARPRVRSYLKISQEKNAADETSA